MSSEEREGETGHVYGNRRLKRENSGKNAAIL
jgi:hypothetical protein